MRQWLLRFFSPDLALTAKKKDDLRLFDACVRRLAG
jgi:hypothetical protein